MSEEKTPPDGRGPPIQPPSDTQGQQVPSYPTPGYVPSQQAAFPAIPPQGIPPGTIIIIYYLSDLD